jgi:hypothetical protein
MKEILKTDFVQKKSNFLIKLIKKWQLRVSPTAAE